MADKQEPKKEKRKEITKENVEVSQKNESKNVKTKKTSSKKENVQSKENKTGTSKKKSESVSTNKKTTSTETKKSNKANSTNKAETNGKKTTKTTGKVNKNSNSKKKVSINSESKEEKNENKKDKNKKIVTKKQNKNNLEEDTEINEENTVTEVKEEAVKLEEIKSTLNKKNKIPTEKLEEIYKTVFKNIIFAAVIVTYFIFLNLGQMNIKPEVYQTDLKVFSITTLLISIVLIERAYKKDSGEIAVYGIETLILSIITLALIYVNLIFSSKYVFIVNFISYIFAIYYLIKSVIVYIKKRKKCYIDDMKEIINKEEE